MSTDSATTQLKQGVNERSIYNSFAHWEYVHVTSKKWLTVFSYDFKTEDSQP